MQDSDHRVSWQAVGELVVVGLVWAAVLTIALQFAAALDGTAGAATAWQRTLAALAFHLGMLVAAVWLVIRHSGCVAVGLRRCEWHWYGVALLLVPVCVVLGIVVRWPGVISARDAFGGGMLAPWQLATMIALVVIVGPATEELIVRGVLQPLLQRRWGIVGVAVGVLGFVLAHGLAGGGAGVVALGIAASWLRLRSGAIIPGLLLHALYNLVVLMAVMLTG